LSFTDSIREIKAVGQDGIVLLNTTLSNTTSSFVFALKEVSHFVRFEIKLKDGSKIYTNPVFRSIDGKKPLVLSAGIDVWASQFYRLLGILVIGFFILRVRNPNRFRKPIFSRRGNRIQA
jgi:dihydroorotate dehydrogenase